VDEYDGVLDWFSKEERAERKLKRAKKARAKGWERRAVRLEQRSGKLKYKAKGGKVFSHKSPARKLWRSKYPWAERPGTRGRGVAYALVGAFAFEKLTQPIAKGTKPPPMFRNREFRSTILGGLQALQAVGVSGYAEMDLSQLKVAIKPDESLDPIFLQLAGKKDNLKDAAEFIRKEVVKHGLEELAWYNRALIMIQPAVVSAQVRGAGASAVLAVGGPSMGPFAAIPAAIAAQEAVHSAILKKEVGGFTQKSEQALEKAGVRQAVEVAEKQALLAKEVADAEIELAEEESKAEAAVLARQLQIAGVVTVLLAAGGVLWWFSWRED
tara:strand:- start:223 stop:1200 length:978 start_codon:yes stop_codon:yes gene_type:complete